MNTHDFKQRLINRLMDRDVFTRRVSDVEIQTRCPFCGDSQKTQRDGHFYIRVDVRDNNPVVYNCFKCPAQGVLTYDDLELLGIEGSEFKDGFKTINKNKYKPKDTAERFFSFKLPNPKDLNKIRYVENRLGYNFKKDELQDIRIITSLKEFLKLNDVGYITVPDYVAYNLEKNYVGFLSYGSSHILFRDVTDREKYKWVKYKILTESSDNKVAYSIASHADLYTDDDIIINLSEGVMDCLSIAYNLDMHGDNILNFAVGGKNYLNFVKTLLSKGFIGDNIVINIFSDNDDTNDTSIQYHKKVFDEYKYFVKEMNVFYNCVEKDCGVPKERIKLVKHRI